MSTRDERIRAAWERVKPFLQEQFQNSEEAARELVAQLPIARMLMQSEWNRNNPDAQRRYAACEELVRAVFGDGVLVAGSAAPVRMVRSGFQAFRATETAQPVALVS